MGTSPPFCSAIRCKAKRRMFRASNNSSKISTPLYRSRCSSLYFCCPTSNRASCHLGITSSITKSLSRFTPTTPYSGLSTTRRAVYVPHVFLEIELVLQHKRFACHPVDRYKLRLIEEELFV